MLTAYFDTNIFITGILQPNSNSQLILQEIKKGKLKVVLSDYPIDEVLSWFKIHQGQRLYLSC